jgi:hypothetical protein
LKYWGVLTVQQCTRSSTEERRRRGGRGVVYVPIILKFRKKSKKVWKEINFETIHGLLLFISTVVSICRYQYCVPSRFIIDAALCTRLNSTNLRSLARGRSSLVRSSHPVSKKQHIRKNAGSSQRVFQKKKKKTARPCRPCVDLGRGRNLLTSFKAPLQILNNGLGQNGGGVMSITFTLRILFSINKNLEAQQILIPYHI